MFSDNEIERLMALIPKHVEKAIVTPHEHEDEQAHPPLWLIWVSDGWNPSWRLDEVSNSEVSARGAVIGVLSGPSDVDPKPQVIVERIPANHRFASSISDEIDKVIVRGNRQRGGHPHYKREGD